MDSVAPHVEPVFFSRGHSLRVITVLQILKMRNVCTHVEGELHHG